MKYYLVTVGGYSSYYNPPDAALTVAIELAEFETVTEWFTKRPTLYFRFEFTPHSLYNFWECSKEDYERWKAVPEDEDEGAEFDDYI
jgi:hypothetical protein